MFHNDLRAMVELSGRRYLLAMSVVAVLASSGTPVQAQAPAGSFATSYSANADKPIDIESDALEVDDKKKLATFKGNVSATQGDFNIRAREIQVTYTSAAKNDPAAPKPAVTPAASALPGGGNADIQQIDAKGKVLITTKDNQTTTSDWAVFEVKKQLVTIGGDVVLTQGTNTIKGTKLVIDLNTGLSRFDTSNDKVGTNAPGERLKAIFTPKARPEKSKTEKPDTEKSN